ncbi:uncharacterized protein LOC110830497 isoform X2 [Zootermopsis nevadensis]|nr:uncharacterized protein LOC110830497 isoform X2 [Zootermopsis nevadensis]
MAAPVQLMQSATCAKPRTDEYPGPFGFEIQIDGGSSRKQRVVPIDIKWMRTMLMRALDTSLLMATTAQFFYLSKASRRHHFFIGGLCFMTMALILLIIIMGSSQAFSSDKRFRTRDIAGSQRRIGNTELQ